MQVYAVQRERMVESQVRTNDVTDVRIQRAMRDVPRERFVPAAKQAVAYSDTPVEVVRGRFLLDPRTFAKLAQLGMIEPTDRVLDVGCASGYSSVVFARLCAQVTCLEEDAELVRIASDLGRGFASNALVVQGKLADGYSAGAPYDVIFLNGAVEAIPERLQQQLAEGGRLVAILQPGPQGRAHVFLKEKGRIGRRADFDSTVPLLPGFQEAKGFVF
jgi:protein-L-isoaspartate(D-aspartate) O-methyltransferase